MKLFQIVLVLALIFCSVNSTKVLNRRSVAQNIYQLVLGALTSIAGPSGDAFTKNCLPPHLQNAGTDESSATSNFAGSSTALKIITAVGKVAINIFCKLKSMVLGAIMKLINRRFFMQRRKRWGIFKKIGRAFKKAANKVAGAAKKVGNAVANAAKKLIDVLNPMTIVKKIINGVKTMIQKIKDFFNSETFKTIKKVFECVLHAKGAVQHVIKVIKGFIAQVRRIMSGVSGLIEALIECICNYSSFLKAVDYLIHAIKKSGLARTNYIGRFIGQLAVAFSGN